MAEKLIAFHGDPAIKAKYVERVRWHKEMDHLAQGVYYQLGGPTPKMCGVGCTIEGSDHNRYEIELGIPVAIAHLEDSLFEGMAFDDAKELPLALIEAVPVAADCSMVASRLMLDILADPEHGTINFATSDEERAATQTVIDLYRRRLKGDEPKKEEWQEASAIAAATGALASAEAAYAEAAYVDAAYTYAAVAAAFETNDVYGAACKAARQTHKAAARQTHKAARQTHFKRIADRLVHHLKLAPVDAKKGKQP